MNELEEARVHLKTMDNLYRRLSEANARLTAENAELRVQNNSLYKELSKLKSMILSRR